MNAVVVSIIAISTFVVGYIVYQKLLSKLFNLNPQNKTPAHAQRDDHDFIPTKNWLVLFGHHFCSICGAGPIIGPILAAAYWGWGPALLWILVGSITFGAAADFSSLILSIRNRGKSISTIAANIISKRASLFFAWFILLTVILLIAVFAIVTAKTLTMSPKTVVPSIGLIPTALFVGFLLNRVKITNVWATLIGLLILALLLVGGNYWAVTLPTIDGLSSQDIWMIILLIYCLIASILPVNILLQPRDYLSSYLLFFIILLGFLSIFITHPIMQSPPYHQWNPTHLWPSSGPLFPMLFITIACGAVSGFHSLVSSGTTAKQIDDESHCFRISYGSMILEGLVAVLVVISVSAGLHYLNFVKVLKADGPLVALGQGFGALSTPLLSHYSGFFIVLAVNTFILTTLDTATRIAMYLTKELTPIKKNFTAALIVVAATALIGFSDTWSHIWPAFGTANQLIAGIALLVVSAWLISNKKRYLITLIPAIFMLIITISALLYQIVHSIKVWDIPILITTTILLIIATAFLAEAISSFRHHRTRDNN